MAILTANSEKLAELRARTDCELAAHVRAKLNSAVHLACQAEHERRSAHWEAAEEYQRKWEAVIAEVKQLLPLLKKNGNPAYENPKPARAGSRQRSR